MNNKGFTLIELLAIILLLAVIMSVGAFTVFNYIEQSRNISYELLTDNIRVGAISHYEECMYNPYSTACKEDYAKEITKIDFSKLRNLAEMYIVSFTAGVSGKIIGAQ